jgi:leucyl/phenylalanyl-tRNA--protein transferase
MSDSRTDQQVFLMDPDQRGIIPLNGLHISRSLKKFMAKSDWTLIYSNDFPSVIRACAQPDTGRESTWISEGLEGLYLELHGEGYAYSVEVYEGTKLIGGLYGVSLGGAFFGESMFSRATNASKVALVGLVKGLNEQGYSLLDTQFLTPHLATLGGIEIPSAEYHQHLKRALKLKAEFPVGKTSVTNLI